MKTTFSAKPDATQRTKNRAREHGSHSINVGISADVEITGRKKNCVLIKCDCSWFGWLPLDEINLGDNDG